MTRSYEGGRTHSTTWLQTPTAHVADVSARAGRGLWWEGHTCAGSATWEGITRWGLLFFPDFCKAVHTAKMPLMHGAGGFLPLMHGAGGFLQGMKFLSCSEVAANAGTRHTAEHCTYKGSDAEVHMRRPAA